MPDPISVCIEDPAAPAEERFLRCVAVRGGAPGLSLDARGLVCWMGGEPAACGLWVSADERLILCRAPQGPVVTVHRAGRWVQAPPDKPVVLLDQDEIEVGGRRLRIHVHGVTRSVHKPVPFVSRPVGRMAAIAAAAVLGAGSVGCKKDATSGAADAGIEVREAPPIVAVPLPDAAPEDAADAPSDAGDADAPVDAPSDGAEDAGDAAVDGGKRGQRGPSIEVRAHPPKPARVDED